MFAVRTGIPAHANQLGSDLADQLFLLVTLHDHQRPLKDIIGKLILHHGDDWAHAVLLGGHDLVN